MMKFKKPRISIKVKIWLAIIAIVMAVIAALWILQVVFLQTNYLKAKAKNLEEQTRLIAQTVNEKGILNSADFLKKAAWENMLCIDFSNPSGFDLVTVEGLGDNCYVHTNQLNRLRLIQAAASAKGEYVLLEYNHPLYNSRYYSCAVANQTQPDGSEYVLIVSTSLVQMGEVTAVIRNQLMWISLILILVATVIAFWVARSLTKPLVRISNAARQIAGGSMNVNVDVRSNDEIGDLGANFNTMSKEIAKVNTLQRELVANISHDIRTPLTMIRGYAEMIKDITGDDKAQREEQLDIIVDETNRLSTLVSDVMDLSLMQAGQSPLNRTDFDLTVKARDILGRYHLYEQTKGFEFHLEANRPFLVNADEVRIEQVIYNLINNAVNHIGVEKRITLRITEENGEAKVEITDTGTGIREEDLPLIWDRYYKPPSQKGMGTGLGLSIVKAILVNHHSRFGVVSTLGVGSTFWFTLALAGEEKTAASEKN